MFFIDESGSIPGFLSKKWKNRYFVMAFVQTQDPKKLQSVYKNSIRNLRKTFPSFFSGLDNPNELKGSEAYPFMKEYIFRQLITKTDINIAHMVVDNWNIDSAFREDPCRSFNFLTKVMLKSCRLTKSDCDHLELRIDNRNSAIKSLNSLEDYLFNELVLGKSANRAPADVKRVTVTYMDSKSSRGVQIADMVANTIYKRYRFRSAPFPHYSRVRETDTYECPETNEKLYQLLRSRISVPYVYPPPYKSRREIAATIR
ncbi:DUF3800 domain-containing protein [Alicyclobacillus acidoterrestris]|uniref:DUF3800 domain-containing protein n=1 Tax=Alicyclobacillus acidoterrestris TaxID=1450 RepID=UPI003F53D87A